jgi:hypothetical protein
MRSRLSIQLAIGAASSLALTVAAHWFCSAAGRPVAFNDVQEFKTFAVSNGLYFHAGNHNGIVESPALDRNYYLADHAITLDDLIAVGHRRDCGLTSAWRGIIWVCQFRGEFGLLPDSLGGKWRVWGNVVVAGDEDLMDRIEDFWRSE